MLFKALNCCVQQGSGVQGAELLVTSALLEHILCLVLLPVLLVLLDSILLLGLPLVLRRTLCGE